jgi:hypothetical protein
MKSTKDSQPSTIGGLGLGNEVNQGLTAGIGGIVHSRNILSNSTIGGVVLGN